MSYNEEEKKETSEAEAAEERPCEESEESKEEACEAKEDAAAKLEAQLAEMNDKFLRTVAEYQNFRNRSQKEKDSLYQDAVCDTAAKFLEVADNFDRALSFECADPEFKKGVEMIYTAFKNVLSNLGVTEIEALGQPFDPNTQNAVMHIEDESVEESTVVDVFQKGYMLKGKVLRHAMVKVAN